MSRDIEQQLPAPITSIVPQKNNKDRYSIFIQNDTFLIGVDESTLLDYNLNKGVEMTPLLFRKIQRAEGMNTIKSYLLRLLARRDHSRKELFDKASKKGYEEEIINIVLDDLEGKGYIDDPSFARTFASEKSRLNNWGPAKIKSHLFKKGISRNVAEESVQSAFEEIDLEKVFRELVAKKRRRFLREEDLFKRKKKIFDYLRRKGYRSENIHQYLDALTKSVDS